VDGVELFLQIVLPYFNSALLTVIVIAMAYFVMVLKCVWTPGVNLRVILAAIIPYAIVHVMRIKIPASHLLIRLVMMDCTAMDLIFVILEHVAYTVVIRAEMVPFVTILAMKANTTALQKQIQHVKIIYSAMDSIFVILELVAYTVVIHVSHKLSVTNSVIIICFHVDLIPMELLAMMKYFAMELIFANLESVSILAILVFRVLPAIEHAMSK
jgi:hypothetical protein